MKEREEIISDYIHAYNHFDVEKMLVHLDKQVVFENISHGVTNMRLTGITMFKEQAEQTKRLFSERKQTVRTFKHGETKTEIEVDFQAVLAMDFLNGLKQGDKITLHGKSIFKFEGDKITEITDIS